MQIRNLKYLLIFNVSTFLRFANKEHQYVSKTCFKFYVKIINTVRTTVYQIAIPYDSKVAIRFFSEIGHDFKLCDKIFLLKNQKQITPGALAVQCMNIIFVCNEELKGSMQGYSLCLLGNQLKFQLQPLGCKRARAPIT